MIDKNTSSSALSRASWSSYDLFYDYYLMIKWIWSWWSWNEIDAKMKW